MVRCCTLTLLLSLSTVTIVRADISLSGDASFASGAAIVGPTAEGRIVATPPSTVTSSRLSIGPTGSPPVRYDSEVLIDGATWTATGQVTVGAGGALTVRGGGSFVQTSGEATFGSPSGLASLTVDGAGSDARFQTGFQFGNGTIEVRNGARLQTPAATLGAATEGNLAGSIDVQIDGPGAEWNPVGSTRIAAGELKVTGGARVDGAGLSLGSTGLSVVARFAGEAGAPSRLGGFTVGDQGYANLLVEEGADISATSTAIGGPAEGIVTLTGRGTTWTTNTLSIGGGKSSSSGGAGELRVLDGATFSANVSEQLQLAFNSGETVRILVDGIDSKLLLSGFRSNTSPAIGLGQRGYAQFIVSGGARQTSGRLTIGSTDTRSNGLVRIIGEGSQWDVGGADVVRGRLELLDSAVMTLTTTGATVGATGVIQLSEGGRIRSGALSSSSSLPSVQNQGLITGSGVIDLPVVNSANGRVVVGPGTVCK